MTLRVRSVRLPGPEMAGGRKWGGREEYTGNRRESAPGKDMRLVRRGLAAITVTLRDVGHGRFFLNRGLNWHAFLFTTDS